MDIFFPKFEVAVIKVTCCRKSDRHRRLSIIKLDSNSMRKVHVGKPDTILDSVRVVEYFPESSVT